MQCGGEECDDANLVNTDFCIDCATAYCGDGHLSPTEVCDDGANGDDSDGCNDSCQRVFWCGNGIPEPGEECGKVGRIGRSDDSTSGTMLTVSQVAASINVCPNSVRHWADSGMLQCYRIGARRDRRFKIEDVHVFLRSSSRELD